MEATRSVTKSYWPSLFFAIFASVTIVAGAYSANHLPTIDYPQILALAILVDLLILLPAAFFFLVTRPYQLGWLSVVPIIVLSGLLAKWLVPAEWLGPFSHFEWILVPIEFGLIALVLFKVTQAIRQLKIEKQTNQHLDAYELLTAAGLQVFGKPLVAKAFAYELAIIYYGLFSWIPGKIPSSVSREDSRICFSCHRDSGYSAIFAAFLIAIFVEGFAVHFLVDHYVGPVLAWVLSLLSIYSFIWLLGDFQALRYRPTTIEEGQIRIRVGLRLEGTIKIDEIDRVESCKNVDRPIPSTTINGSIMDQPTIAIQLSGPQTFARYYGLSKTGERLLLSIDEPQAFLEFIPLEKRSGQPDDGGGD